MKWIIASAVLLFGCGEGTRLPPLPVDKPDDDTTTTTSTTQEPPVETKREVIQRNPFGNVAARDNLLWDGDFEWRAPFGSQPGWFQFNNQFFGNTTQAFGAVCRSGVKCARLERGDQLIGLAVPSEGDDLLVSFWVQPEDGDCLAIASQLWSQETQSSSDPILPVSDTPDDSGWCSYSAVVPERKEAQYLYISNDSSAPALVDDAVITVASGDQAMALKRRRVVSVHDPALSDRLRDISRTIVKPRILPKSKGQIAWEKLNERRWRIGK